VLPFASPRAPAPSQPRRQGCHCRELPHPRSTDRAPGESPPAGLNARILCSTDLPGNTFQGPLCAFGQTLGDINPASVLVPSCAATGTAGRARRTRCDEFHRLRPRLLAAGDATPDRPVRQPRGAASSRHRLPARVASARGRLWRWRKDSRANAPQPRCREHESTYRASPSPPRAARASHCLRTTARSPHRVRRRIPAVRHAPSGTSRTVTP